MADAANYWHDLFRKECLLRGAKLVQDDAARLGTEILVLEQIIDELREDLARAQAEAKKWEGLFKYWQAVANELDKAIEDQTG